MDITSESTILVIHSGRSVPTNVCSATFIPWKLTVLSNICLCDRASKSDTTQLSSYAALLFPNFSWTGEAKLMRCPVEMRITFCSYFCKTATKVSTKFSSEISKPCSQPTDTCKISNKMSATLPSESQSITKTSLHFEGQNLTISLRLVFKDFKPINNESVYPRVFRAW